MTESYSSRTINEEEIRKTCQISVLIVDQHVLTKLYTPLKTKMTLENQPFESIYLLSKMVIFQLAMLVYWRVIFCYGRNLTINLAKL